MEDPRGLAACKTLAGSNSKLKTKIRGVSELREAKGSRLIFFIAQAAKLKACNVLRVQITHAKLDLVFAQRSRRRHDATQVPGARPRHDGRRRRAANPARRHGRRLGRRDRRRPLLPSPPQEIRNAGNNYSAHRQMLRQNGDCSEGHRRKLPLVDRRVDRPAGSTRRTGLNGLTAVILCLLPLAMVRVRDPSSVNETVLTKPQT